MQKFKILLILFFLVLQIPTYAQWKQVMGKSELPPHSGVVFSKYNTILTSSGGESINYSKDNGVNWRTIRPNVFKTSDTLFVNSSLINEQGIFAFMSKKFPVSQFANSDSLFIVSTPNFGTTWEKTQLPIHRIRNYTFTQTKDYIFLYADGYASTDVWSSESKFIVMRYNKSNKIWENKSSEYGYYPAFLKVTDVAEYSGSYDNLQIKFHNGQVVNKALQISGNLFFQVVADSLLNTFYNTSSGVSNISFSQDFSQTWYSIGSSFPLPKGDSESPNFYMYKNKLYGISNGSVYSSTDKGQNWTFESNEIAKYSTSIKPYYRDSIAIFKVCEYMNFGYNLLTKKISYYNTELVLNSEYLNMTNRIDRLPNGGLIYKTCLPNLHLVSDSKGENWKPSLDYPFYFEKIPINDSTFYAKSGLINPTTGRSITGMYVNNVLKDTISFVPSYGNFVKKGDTIVLSTPSLGQKLYYSTQKPYDRWTVVPNSAFLAAQSPILFGDKHIITYNFTGPGTIQLIKVALDGTYEDIPTQYDYSLLNFSQPDDLWFGNSLGTIFQTSNYGQTRTTFKFPMPKSSYSVPSPDDANMLVVVKKTNVPKGKIMIVTVYNTPYITVDSGKFWMPFSNGLEEQNIVGLLQTDSLLFAFTEAGGVYKRDLSDIVLRSVTGNVYVDKNNNNIKDADETPVIAKISSKRTGAFTLSDSTGFYNLLYDGNTTDSISVTYDSRYASYVPNFHIITRSDTGKHFAIRLTPNVNDLSVNLTAITPPRPGFNNTYILNYKNIGSVPKDGTLNLVYDSNQSLVSSTVTPFSNSNQILTWRFTNLQPTESKTIQFAFKTNIGARIGNQITNIARIEPIETDTFKSDNIDTLVQTIVGSFDPNDKQVSFQNSKTAPSVIRDNTELIYTIRFQNTGNYPADFVRIEDTLSDKLNIASLRMLSSSHPYKVMVKEGRILVFDFNPIYLPDSLSNEAFSHGFIKFGIKPKSVIPKGQSIKNTAYIYFDYNPAIKTNIVETQSTLSKLIFPVQSELLPISPNPAKSSIRFSLPSNFMSRETNIRIYNINGALLLTKLLTINTENQMDISHLNSGSYIIHINIDEQNFIGKFIVNR